MPFRLTGRLTDLVALAAVLDSTGRLSLALLAKPLVVQPLDGVVERQRPVAAARRGVQRVKDCLRPVPAQGDRVNRGPISRSSIASATGRAPAAPSASGSCAAVTRRVSAMSVAARWSSG
jgi:hypothetical protein